MGESDRRSGCRVTEVSDGQVGIFVETHVALVVGEPAELRHPERDFSRRVIHRQLHLPHYLPTLRIRCLLLWPAAGGSEP